MSESDSNEHRVDMLDDLRSRVRVWPDDFDPEQLRRGRNITLAAGGGAALLAVGTEIYDNPGALETVIGFNLVAINFAAAGLQHRMRNALLRIRSAPEEKQG